MAIFWASVAAMLPEGAPPGTSTLRFISKWLKRVTLWMASAFSISSISEITCLSRSKGSAARCKEGLGGVGQEGEVVASNGSKKDSLILECVRLREVARAGAARRASLALEDALATLVAKLLKVLGLDLLATTARTPSCWLRSR